MIREAEEADIPDLVRMGLRFVNESTYRDHLPAEPGALQGLMARLIASDASAVFILEYSGHCIGMIGLHVFDHPMSGQAIAGEVFWWVDPEVRGEGMKLLKRGEEWGLERGAVKMQVVAPNERVSRVYTARGYTKIEEHFQKDIRECP